MLVSISDYFKISNGNRSMPNKKTQKGLVPE